MNPYLAPGTTEQHIHDRFGVEWTPCSVFGCEAEAVDLVRELCEVHAGEWAEEKYNEKGQA